MSKTRQWGWERLLIDSNPYNVRIAKIIIGKKVTCKEMWITLDTLDFVLGHYKLSSIGILSVDVDGNDY